jgi:predicted outer membrane repeat protein
VYRLLQASLTILLVAAMLVGPAGAAPADTVVGDGTPGSCTESAFGAAVAAGDTITFNCGVPKTIQLTHPVTIMNDFTTIDGGNVVTLTGNLTTPLLIVTTGSRLTLDNLTLDRGNANNDNDGGAINSFGTLYLDHVRIQNSIAGEFGGAIFTQGDVDIRNSTFTNNSAKSGGAIYAPNTLGITIRDSTFQLNEALDGANGAGGAIWLGPGSELNVSGGEMGENGAQVAGGALYLAPGAQATFGPSGATAAEVELNSALDFGGAIYNDAGTLTLRNTRVEYNRTLTNTTAVGYGGGIADLGTLVVENSAIANNQGRFGGGLFVGGTTTTATASITRTSFFANVASVYGGGLYTNINTTTVTIEDDLFAFNHASAGGGLARTNANLSISKSSFTSNQAQFGGGMFVQGLPNPDDAGYVEIRDSTLSGNLATSQHSGGIDNSARLDLRNVTIKDNHYGLWDENGATGRLQGTVLDNPGFPNCDGDGTLPTSGGHNLATDNSCNLSVPGGDQIGVDAMLGPLTSDPLVFTEFHLPLAGSPLINNGGPGCSATDQRYALRTDACDIGAIEFGGLLPRLFVPLVWK